MNNIGVLTTAKAVITLVDGGEIYVNQEYDFLIEEIQTSDKLIFVTTNSPFGKFGVEKVKHTIIKDKVAVITEIKTT